MAEAQIFQEETMEVQGEGIPSARVERTVEMKEELDDAGLSEDQLKQLLSIPRPFAFLITLISFLSLTLW